MQHLSEFHWPLLHLLSNVVFFGWIEGGAIDVDLEDYH